MIEQLYILPILLFSVVIHEIAHGWMALRLGDPTAKMMGRLTLNPIPHIDPVGSILVPLFSL
ncbi:MAG TPA: site-2 protease family protein, partial [Bacteroidota bacterium]|nr:site-2 protease family protein [Bacteroidota bacterium]